MKLEQQCVSLEIARKLKELNVSQQSLFCYIDNDELEFLPTEIRNNNVCVAAFTVAELLDMLPPWIDTKKDEPFNSFWLHLQKRSAENIRYILNYRCDTYEPPAFMERLLISPNIHDSNLANALGKLLIYLIENNLMPEKIEYASIDEIKEATKKTMNNITMY